MPISELITLIIVLACLFGFLIFICIDNHKNSVAYRKALDSVNKIHCDLIELINVMKARYYER